MNADRRTHLFWLAAFVVLLVAMALLRAVLLPFVLGFLLAYFLNPLVDRLQATGLARTWAVTLIIGVGVLVGIGLMVFLMPLLLDQLKQLIASLPSDLDRLRISLESFLRERTGDRYPAVQEGLDKVIGDIKANLGSLLGSMAAWIWSGGSAVISLVSLFLVTPMVVYYLLIDWHRVVDGMRSYLPRDHATTVERLMSDINDAVSAFVRGQGTLCVILGIVYAIGLSALGLRYGVLIGLATGLLSFVPVVGWSAGLLLGLAVTISQYGVDMTMLAATLMVFLVGQVLEAVLSPTLVGEKIGLHPVWMIFALFSFSYLFGIVGTLVAVPVSAALAVLVRYALSQYLASDVYNGKSTITPP